MSPADFATPTPRPGIIDALRKDAAALAGDPREVLLCFTCDPYQPLEDIYHLTRQALEVLASHGIRPRILTKNPAQAVFLDQKLLIAARAILGTSLSWTDAFRCLMWEPGAPCPEDRIRGIRRAHGLGLRTWLSIEPVIDPVQALEILRTVGREVDEVKVGKLNHNAEVERTIDWTRFCREAVQVASCGPAGWYIKNDLWKFADAETRAIGQSGKGKA